MIRGFDCDVALDVDGAAFEHAQECCAVPEYCHSGYCKVLRANRRYAQLIGSNAHPEVGPVHIVSMPIEPMTCYRVRSQVSCRVELWMWMRMCRTRLSLHALRWLRYWN